MSQTTPKKKKKTYQEPEFSQPFRYCVSMSQIWGKDCPHLTPGSSRRWVNFSQDQDGRDPTVRHMTIRDTEDTANRMQKRPREKHMADCPSSRRDPAQGGRKNKGALEPLIPVILHSHRRRPNREGPGEAPTGMWPRGHHLEWKPDTQPWECPYLTPAMEVPFLQLCYVTGSPWSVLMLTSLSFRDE
uniref:RIKEN cDNA E030025P04 gene n=1 Tax=Mus spicilegus TaxID=10103 RepID=A0A8C6HIT5_MUSSI